jgi:hypothetical protein
MLRYDPRSEAAAEAANHGAAYVYGHCRAGSEGRPFIVDVSDGDREYPGREYALQEAPEDKLRHVGRGCHKHRGEPERQRGGYDDAAASGSVGQHAHKRRREGNSQGGSQYGKADARFVRMEHAR